MKTRHSKPVLVGLSVFSDGVLHFLQIKKKFYLFYRNYLVALNQRARLISWLGDQLHTTSTSQWWSLSCTVAGAERVDRPFARPFRGAVSGVFWASSRSLGPYFCELPVAGPQVLVIYFISCIVSCCFYYCYYLLLYFFFPFFLFWLITLIYHWFVVHCIVIDENQ